MGGGEDDLGPDPLPGIKSFILELEYKERYASRNRLSLLLIHGIASMIIGYNILKYGPPTSFMGLNPSGFADIALGLSPLIGGFTLVVGLIFGRFMILEGIGITFILIWDLWMTSGFYLAYDKGVLVGNNPYPIYIYAALSGFMVIHTITFYKFLSGEPNGKL